MKKLLLNFSLALFVFLTTFVGMDFFLQGYLGVPSRYLRQLVTSRDDLLPHKRILPGLQRVFTGAYREFRFEVTTSQDGFRNNKKGYAYSLKEHEAVMIGDSQTFGIGVEDSQTIAAILSGLTGRKVLNAACPGYSNIEEFLLAEELLQKTKPEILFVNLFLGNDPFENSRHGHMLESEERESEPAKQISAKRPVGLGAFKEYLSKHSAFYQFIIRLRQIPSLNHLTYRMNLANEAPPQELLIFNQASPERGREFLDTTGRVITKISELAKENGVRFILVIIPDRYQVDAPYWQQWVVKYRLNPQDHDLKAPNQYFQDFCTKNNLECVDTLPALLEASKTSEKLYWEIDNHLAAEGNAVIANLIADSLNHE